MALPMTFSQVWNGGMGDLESVFQGLSIAQPNPPSLYHPPSNCPGPNYEYEFENIISFVNNSFRSIPDEERTVTRAFARPFTPGGLLVLLQEPLANHPWSSGIEAVISSCPSLGALREGIARVSQGGQCITNNVSVMDRWPFLSQTLHKSLEVSRCAEMERYDSLVLAAIRAKQPNVILCMGSSAKTFLFKNKPQLVLMPGRFIDIVYCCHPSYSINYEFQNCHKTRETLLVAIQDACNRLRSNIGTLPQPHPWNNMLPPQQYAFSYTNINQPAQYGKSDAEIVRGFIGTLAELCFPFDQKLPVRCLSLAVQPCYYSFTTQQLNFLRHTLVCTGNGSYDTMYKDEALWVLVPLLMKLNNTLTRTTYFSPTYTVDMRRVTEIMAETPSNIEQMCLRMVDHSFPQPPNIYSYPSGVDLNRDILQRLETIANALDPLLATSYQVWKTGQRYQPSYQQQPGCRCGTSVLWSDNKLTAAFQQAYTLTHDCTTCSPSHNYGVSRAWW